MNNKLLSLIKPFYVMEILEKAQELEKGGKNITHLEIGEPTYKVHELIRRHAKLSINKGKDKYSSSLGLLSLRKKIADRYKAKFGVEVSENEVILTTGSSAALILALISLIKNKDQVVLVEPYYPCYPQLIKILGGKVRVFKTHAKDGYQIDTNKLKKFINKEDKVLIINSPSNPTGVSQKDDVLSFLSTLKINIISDEIYQGLSYIHSPDTMLKYKSDAIIINGFSKFYSMTGWRLGYLIVPKNLIRGVQKLHQNMYICAPTISQNAAIGALSISDNDINKMLDGYKKKREYMISNLIDMGISLPYIPDSAFYVFADMSKFTNDSLSLSMDILESVGLGVAPGIDFGPSFKKYVRFSYSSSLKNIQIGLDKMREYIKEYT